MKKILSVILAVMMLFASMAIGASAETYEGVYGGSDESVYNGTYKGYEVPGNFSSASNVILILDFGKGVSKEPVKVYNPNVPGGYELISGATGQVVVVGDGIAANYSYKLPFVTPADGDTFNGWYCYADTRGYTAGPYGAFKIPDLPGEVILLEAQYYNAAAEGDTLGNILGILTKVFGAILGILFYGGDTESGVAMMDKIFSGLDL